MGVDCRGCQTLVVNESACYVSWEVDDSWDGRWFDSSDDERVSISLRTVCRSHFLWVATILPNVDSSVGFRICVTRLG